MSMYPKNTLKYGVPNVGVESGVTGLRSHVGDRLATCVDMVAILSQFERFGDAASRRCHRYPTGTVYTVELRDPGTFKFLLPAAEIWPTVVETLTAGNAYAPRARGGGGK